MKKTYWVQVHWASPYSDSGHEQVKLKAESVKEACRAAAVFIQLKYPEAKYVETRFVSYDSMYWRFAP